MSTDPYPPQPGPVPDSTPPASSVPPPGTPPYAAPTGGPAPSSSDRFFDSIRRSGLARSEDRWVGGVAGGVAERLGWDPLLVRGILFLSFFLTGIGLVVYAVGWALLPERRDGRIHLQQAMRGDFDVALLGAAAALLVGFGWSDGFGSWWNGGHWGWIITLFWIAVWVTAGWLLIRFVHERRRERQAVAPYPTQASPTQPYPTRAPYPTQPGPPTTDARAYAAWARAEADRARTDARNQAAGARAEAAQARAAASRHQGQVRAAAQQQRAQARAAERASRPITKSAGAATVGIVFGLLLIAGALMLAQERSGLSLPWPFGSGYDPVLAWIGISLVIIGAAIVVSGIRGRSSGWLGFFAIVGLVVALPWSISTADAGFPSARISRDLGGTWHGVGANGIDVSQGTVAPRSVAEAERGFRAQFGDPTIDLSSLDLAGATTDDPVVVPIQLTAGDLTVLVPRDAAVEADVRLLAGQLVWQVDPETRTLTRVGSSITHLSSDEASEHGATLRLLVSAGAGNVTVTED
ncbi:PspC domain-containing protein [Xylanimonas sp. McL0601]|uniref:PspC domain-containing protein n=1 Tax=Xylanimonas sp. McL0601 TaxID=3414739 RepID=UPI003CFB930C